MFKKIIIPVAVVLALVVCIVAYRYYSDNKKSNFTADVELFVTPEDGVEDVLGRLEASGAVRNMKSLRRSFGSKRVAEYLTVGHYVVKEGSPSVYVARMLNNNWQTPVRVTLSGNLRLKGNIAAKISSQLLIDSTTVRHALDNDTLLANYGFSSSDVFSLLMPATYEMYWTADMEDFLDRQKEAYDAFWTQENLEKSQKLGLSPKEVSVLASIVTGESNYAPEMPKIAGVYLNRLAIGMPLQADPTVAYCFDYRINRVLSEHLKVDSPYNTYKNNGLPPGPICVPVKAALEAVLNPDYGGTRGRGNLYFCANPDFSGTHVFARTFSEHNRNAEAFRRELNRRKIYK